MGLLPISVSGLASETTGDRCEISHLLNTTDRLAGGTLAVVSRRFNPRFWQETPSSRSVSQTNSLLAGV